MHMHYHHLYSGPDGESHWREVAVTVEERSFAPPAKAIEISETEPATGTLFLRLAAGWDEPPHPTPRAQVLVCLRGRIAVTASDGEVREIGPGDVWRMEDTHGKGHHTRVLGDTAMECVIVQLP
jgi:quercetin dioxygenase-like cupin family protein